MFHLNINLYVCSALQAADIEGCFDTQNLLNSFWYRSVDEAPRRITKHMFSVIFVVLFF